MPQRPFCLINRLAVTATLLALAAGCEPSSQGESGRATPAAVMRVEIVHPERHTVRRSVGEPGELQAFETTPIHAKLAGYVKNWSVNIGATVKKGQVLAELSVPELDAEVRQKEASVRHAVAAQEQARASIRMAEANVAGAEAKLVEVRAGVKRRGGGAEPLAISERAGQGPGQRTRGDTATVGGDTEPAPIGRGGPCRDRRTGKDGRSRRDPEPRHCARPIPTSAPLRRR